MNAFFVPPPPDKVMELMGELELLLHQNRQTLPHLIRAGLVHVQFETIHPLLDGNGRLGRLLITFLLCTSGALKDPILYLSLFFKANRQAYYDHLTQVRVTGDWESWLEFFLRGVRDTAEQAAGAARRMIAMLEADRKKIEALGRPAASALRIHQYTQTRPIFSIRRAVDATGVSYPTVAGAVEHIQELGILKEITGKQRDRLYAYSEYLATLNERTEALG